MKHHFAKYKELLIVFSYFFTNNYKVTVTEDIYSAFILSTYLELEFNPNL